MLHETAKIIDRLFSGLLLVVVLTSCASSTKNDDSASVYLQLGVRYMDLGKLEVAKENLQRAQKKSPIILRYLTHLLFYTKN